MPIFQITLRAARINKDLSLEQVGSMTKKHPETIRKWEIDSTDIPRKLLKQLLAIYGVPEDYIFFGKESVFIGLNKPDIEQQVAGEG